MSLQVCGVLTLSECYLRPALGTENIGRLCTLGCTVCVGSSVSVFCSPPVPPSSSCLLACSRAWVEPLLACSLVSRSRGWEPQDGRCLYFFISAWSLFYSCSVPSILMPSSFASPSCTSRRTKEQDCQGKIKLAWILLHSSCLGIFLHRVYGARPIY